VSVPRSELNLSSLNKFAHRGKGRKEATIIKIHKPIHPRGISFGRVRARALVAAASLSLSRSQANSIKNAPAASVHPLFASSSHSRESKSNSPRRCTSECEPVAAPVFHLFLANKAPLKALEFILYACATLLPCISACFVY
jgi:hypothetical protein